MIIGIPLSVCAQRAHAQFTPAAIPSLNLWLDPSFGLYQERTSPVTPSNDGDPVGTWIARTGQACYAPSNAARPILRANSGKPYLEFDGVDDYLFVPSATIPQPHTVEFATHGIAYTAVSDQSFVRGDGGGAVFYTNSLNSNNLAFFGGSVLDSSSKPVGAHVLGLIQDSGNGTIYVDGTSVATGATGGASFVVAGSALYLMSQFAGITADVDLHDFMIFTSALTAAERLSVDRYLGSKYGISVA